MRKEPVKIREYEISRRITDFQEVVLGYNEKEARLEAKRCLQCPNPACQLSCPIGVSIKEFISQIAKGDFKEAYFTIRQKNDFPSICGRVCPAEYQCRKTCVLTKKDALFASEEAINIHFLERFAGDYGLKNNLKIPLKDKQLVRFKVAVVGSGPAGLACAGELARQGIGVDIFESLHKPGGVLKYGIPPFRLPRDILDYEINYLKELGVQIIPNFIVGRLKRLDELFKEGHSSIFLGMGAGVPSFLGIEGENLCNVYSANEFLTRVNLMSADKFPYFHTPINIGKQILVIGGGNTAIDASRVALRLQVINGFNPDVTILYRRTENEMPARRLEINHAREEGVKFEFLVQPAEFVADEAGRVQKLTCLRCCLAEPDESKRRRPVIIEGSSFQVGCSLAIIAVGLGANSVLTNVTPDLKTDKYRDIIVNPQTMETSIKGVFAGGDIVGGEGTVIEAMSMAKKAASSIIERLSLPASYNSQL
ncbi:MAG: NADPH-dependent glutamate synthase [Candidatus Omnitrophota bacterium]|nr:NADPH-dependent glutamate synthase [Candidatus Omnitrophota bacterium]